MSPQVNRLIRALQFQTSALLTSQGEHRLAIAIDHCHQKNLCNQRAICPRCAFERADRRWKAIRQTIESLSNDPSLVFLAFTDSPGTNIPLTELRQNARRFMRNLHRRIGRIPRIAGSLIVLESVPARSPAGERIPGTEYMHSHGLLAIEGELVHFEQARFDHSEIIPAAEDALGWATYCMKASPRDFAQQHWNKLLAVRETFIERARQLRGLRPVRSAGRLKTALSGSLQLQPHTVRKTAA